MQHLTAIGFDADDTLWQNEKFFKVTEQSLASLLGEYSTCTDIHAALLDAERRNIQRYGYGIKGFTLSMIETAIEVTQNRVPVQVIRQIVDLGKEMLDHPIELLPGAESAIRQLLPDYSIVLITKGDLIDQERKIAQSGLGDLFDAVEIVSEKDALTYSRVFSAYGDGPDRAMMVGNSLKSDVLPALEAGSWGVYIPHELNWELEQGERPHGNPRFHELRRICDILPLIASIEGCRTSG